MLFIKNINEENVTYISKVLGHNYTLKQLDELSPDQWFDAIRNRMVDIVESEDLQDTVTQADLIHLLSFTEIFCLPKHIEQNVEFLDGYYPMLCPKEGEFIGYKKAMVFTKIKHHHCRDVIVELRIPANAKRSSGILSNKCRCSKATVLRILNPRTGKDLDGINTAYSAFTHINRLEYTIGKEVIPDGFNENRFKVCARGIHFFMTFEEALMYNGG